MHTLYNLNKYVTNILKAYVKDENNIGQNSTTFSNFIRNDPSEDDEIMLSFDVTFVYANILLMMMINLLEKRLYLKTSFLI